MGRQQEQTCVQCGAVIEPGSEKCPICELGSSRQHPWPRQPDCAGDQESGGETKPADEMISTVVGGVLLGTASYLLLALFVWTIGLTLEREYLPDTLSDFSWHLILFGKFAAPGLPAVVVTILRDPGDRASVLSVIGGSLVGFATAFAILKFVAYAFGAMSGSSAFLM